MLELPSSSDTIDSTLKPIRSSKYTQDISYITQNPSYSVNISDLGEDGSLVSEFIIRQGDNPPLQRINLEDYSLPLGKLVKVIQFLSICKFLTHVNLLGIALGEAGHQLAESIRSWGDEAPLQKLGLYNCSLTKTASLELVQSLSTCRHLTLLDLGAHKLGEAGHQLAESIRSFGDEPPLQKLGLYSCSLTKTASLKLVQSLSICRHLTLLDLGENKLGKAGHQLAESIRSWGDKPPLQKLWLYNCSLPATASFDLVQSLSTCRQLTELNLTENELGESGHQLAESIRSWGDDPPLQKLWLYNCSLPATASFDLVQSLSTCRQLTELNLTENKLGEVWTSTCRVNQILGR